MKTLDYIELLKARYGSDYRTAKELGIAKSAISIYRNKGGTFDETTAVKVAELLNIEPAEVLANIHAERAKDEKVRKIWEAMAEHFHSAAAAVMLAILAGSGITFYPSPSMASGNSLTLQEYTLCEVMRDQAGNCAREY